MDKHEKNMILTKQEDGLQRAASQCLRNAGKQDLERARLQQMLERSCWIINNERISLMWAYTRHLKIMG